MTLSQFTAEIENDLVSFAESNDIDRVSIKLWVIDCLKRFGVNICSIEEGIFKVENSKAILPDTFKSLRLAMRTTPLGCDKKYNCDAIPYVYRQRIENPAYFDEITQEYITSCNPKIITEQIIIENTPVNFYHNCEYLSLVKGISKSVLSTDCINMRPGIRDAYPHQINITGNVVNTNFNEGEIYVQYYTLPQEDGELSIPEITTGDILQYVKTYVKANLAEFLIANNKNPQGLSQLYPVWMQQLPLLKGAAMREAKFSGLSKNWNKKYQAVVKRDIARYNLPMIKF